MLPANDDRVYDLSIGRYDVEVKAGPSFTTQRQETREMLLELLRVQPAAAPYMADVFFDHLDFVGADKLAERARAMLPSQIQQLESQGAQSALSGLPDEVKALVAQGMQQIDQLKQQVKALQPEALEAQLKQQELQLRQQELQSNERIKLAELGLKERELRVKEAELGIAATQAVTAAQGGAAIAP